jgi:hypothetical protein
MFSALPLKADIEQRSRHVRFVPNADINCRDCVVRSLAGPEPDRQVFAKFKHLSRKAAARSSKTIYVTIGEILRAFRPPNAPLAMPNP